MKRHTVWILVSVLVFGSCDSAVNAAEAAAVPGADVLSAIALAETVPLLTLNLNNYKHSANPILTAGEKGAWDEAGIERVAVMRLKADDWRMWYACTGSRRSIGLATSKDGVRWTKYAGNPVLEPTEPWEEGYMSPTSVLEVKGRFYLYYWGPSHVFPDRVTGKMPPPKMKYIALATSEDGIHWTRQGNVDGRKGAVLGPEPPGINEHPAVGGSGVDAAKVFYLPEEPSRPWRMIYTAFGLHGQWNGLAESDDGMEWHRTNAPIADHSGFYTRATGNHHDSGQTIRCPVRIGSVWAGLSYELDSRDSAPIVGLSLDRWIALGRRTLYRNQDYERGSLHPWSVEADDEWFYVYYSTGQQSLGLIRAPKRSVHQPIVLWEQQAVEPAGLQTKILEPDRLTYALHLTSDQDGELRLVVWNPAAQRWLELDAAPVQAAELSTIASLPSHARLRVKFTPRDARANVSAWLVPN
ncbi:MAG: hypothetical protein FJ276_03330 [Planctomycetes bacterium]|nr:hypothetical protein [Planctomycetota bacterium]